MARGLLLKLLAIGGLAAALGVPLLMIGQKVLEREARQHAVQRDIAASAAEAQRVTGPLVAFACSESYWEWVVPQGGRKEDAVRERRRRPCPPLVVLPERLRVSGTVQTEVRRRGIYAARVYRGELRLAGEIRIPAPAAGTGPDERRYSDPALVVAITDPRGLKGMPRLAWLGETRMMQPGAGPSGLGNGLHLPLGAGAAPGSATFALDLALAGTERLEIAPVARETEVHLASGWPHPSFVGRYLPDLREVGDTGFNATWRTTHFATGAPEEWRRALAAGAAGHANVLGVAFVEPVHFYALAYRATEYGFLFVALTFGLFLVAETLKGVRIHAVQYGLVGLALAVFFLLLLALAEHVGFVPAYVAAASACVALLAFYARHVFGSRRAAALYSGWNVALYGVLYVVLRSEDHALLLGATVVFAALAAAMVATRRVDWYALSDRLGGAGGRRPAARAGAPGAGG